ncbi:hypothetical protein DFH07DRAFT_688106, partial [Mycena maculata]
SSDLIPRSSDLVDFHTHKTILAFFSASGGTEGDDIRDGKLVVQLSEPSNMLHKLLLLCYPQAVTEGVLANLDGICLAYHAADKYQIPGARDVIQALLPKFAKEEPHRVYAIACHL